MEKQLSYEKSVQLPKASVQKDAKSDSQKIAVTVGWLQTMIQVCLILLMLNIFTWIDIAKFLGMINELTWWKLLHNML